MSDKIQLIIWSRDRACQTETLLNSIERFAPDLFDISIIYSFSEQKYLDAYKELGRDNHEIVQLIRYNPANFYLKTEGIGKKLLLDIINSNKNKIICFTTEDTILHSTIPTSPNQFMDDCDIFSLRLGMNTIVQNHTTGELQPKLSASSIIPINEETWEVLYWNFLNYPPLSNYGYPFGLDMVCYNKQMIVPLIEKCNFDKPPQLESELIRFRNSINPKIKCFEHSCAVNVPISNMTGNTANAGVSLEELNSQYLSGKKLRYKLDKPIIGCHQILEYEFIS